ncbi:MAG: hypothetical protein HY814_11550 [Candidatus Riflebacteria bacterium]|nr:hypothetical protein [Candidatus Riflebacteria bacterium]
MPSAEATPRIVRAPWWLAVLVTVVLVAAATANSAAFMAESQNHLEVGEFASSACQVARVQAVSGILTWAVSQHYYPPLYMTWLSLPVTPGVRPSLSTLVLWSDVLVVAGLLGLALALWRLGASTAAMTVALCFLLGGPLFNLHTKTLSFECGVVGSVGVLLGLLSGPRGLPGRRGAVVLGLAGAVGLLFKWTVAFYVLGPVAVAIVTWFRTGGTVREALLRLGIAVAVAVAVAGPWYFFCLDWNLIRITAENDPTTPPGRWTTNYQVRLLDYFDKLRLGSGYFLWPLLVTGVGVTLFSRPRGSGLFLSSALGALLVLPSFQHGEARYLLPLLPATAATAGLGMGSLGGAAPAVAVAVVGLGALQSVWQSTWYHYWHADHRRFAGHQAAADWEMRLVWPSRVGRLVYQRFRAWRDFIPHQGGPLSLGVHPLNVHTGLDPQLFFFLANSELARGEQTAVAGYDWTSYCKFLDDVQNDRVAFLAVSESIRVAGLDGPRSRAALAWTYVRQDGQGAPCPGPGPPEDPFVLELLRQRYAILERYVDTEGEVWLMVNRAVWNRSGLVRPIEPVEERPPFFDVLPKNDE